MWIAVGMSICALQGAHLKQHPVTYNDRYKGRSEGGPGVPVTPLCKPFSSKQPTIFRGENAMTIMFDTV